MKSLSVRHFLPLLFLAVLRTAYGQLINGDFNTGDFTGWTLFNTPNGHSVRIQVGWFDMAGTGVESRCANFNVGQILYDNVTPEGAGIYQDVTINGGQLNISLDIASKSYLN